MLKQIIIPVETFVARGVRAVKWFFMCMNRSDVPFEMLSTAEALAAVFHFADINASLTSLSCFSFYCGIVAGGRDAATATLFLSGSERE